jgi:hypothetical protein
LRDGRKEIAFESARVNYDSLSNEIDESDPAPENHSRQRIGSWRGIVIDSREEESLDVIGVDSNPAPNEMDANDLLLAGPVEQRNSARRGPAICMREAE